PLYNEAALEDQELIHNRTADGAYEWNCHDSCWALSAYETQPLNNNTIPSVAAPSLWSPAALRVESVRFLLITICAILMALIMLAAIIFGIAVVIAKYVFLVDQQLTAKPLIAVPESTWYSRTPEEQLALYDLATDGFVNHKNCAIKELNKRG